MKILAFPFDETNPYQRLLYSEMSDLGADVRYIGRLTRSQSLNLLLLPFELVARRVAGGRLVHLHWIYLFSIRGSQRFPVLRRAAQLWFTAWLRTISILGMRLVWTAHNVLPHTPVFADDTVARRQLIEACDLVIAHSQTTLDELAVLGAEPSRSVVIGHGPFSPSVPPVALRTPGSGAGPRRFLFFGKIQEYKGIEELLAAFTALPSSLKADLVVAGLCSEPALLARLHASAQAAASRVVLRLQYIPDEEVPSLLAAADAVVLPFRRITTSGSAMLALAHGRPLIVPNLASLADLPEHAVVRYDGTVQELTAALIRLTQADGATLARMSIAARAYASSLTWREIAARAMFEMKELLGGMPNSETASKILTRS
jgi:glycosyltransferase involved in cell wall biosynthesis